MTAPDQPSGTVTLVFTDIEGSTRLLEELGTDAYREALARHREIVRAACARFDVYEVDYERRSIEVMRQLGDGSGEVIELGLLAMAHAAAHEPQLAREVTAQQLERMGGWCDETLRAEALTVLAIAAAEEGAVGDAVRVWGAAERTRDEESFHVSPELQPYVEDLLEPLREHEDFAELWAEGAALGTNEAIELGLRPSA
jgi:class 3 adenylate cyclase